MFFQKDSTSEQTVVYGNTEWMFTKKVDILHWKMLPKELDYFLKIRIYNDGPNIRLEWQESISVDNPTNSSIQKRNSPRKQTPNPSVLGSPALALLHRKFLPLE